MPIADVATVIDYFRAHDLAPGKWVGEASKVPGVSEQGLKSLRNLQKALEGFIESAQPWDVLAKILLDRTRMAASVGAL